MSNRTHIVQSGDTLSSLSVQFYGEPSQARKIKSANPGTGNILVVGSTLVIPSETGDTFGTEGAGLRFRVDGVTFQFATAVSWTRRIDGMDDIQLTVPQAETEAFRDLITPLSFRDLEVSDDGARIFNGTMVSVVPALTNDGSVVNISGYSRPGVLADCTMPASSYPISFRKLGLEAIATKLVEPFSLKVKIEGDMGGPFRRVKLKRSDKIWGFLSDLAQQRQVLIRSNTAGDLVLSAPTELTAPVVSLSQDLPPITAIEPSFAPQNYFSHVTGVRSTRRGRKGSQYTAQNQRAIEQGIVRPVTKSIKDTSDGELPKATEAAMGRMLAKSVFYTVTVVGWRDAIGALWQPGTTIELHAPSVFVYEPYLFQIQSVTLDRTVTGGDTAKLVLMLPGSFGGTPPAVLPWG